jgi:nucleotide-binding universal stress UspA family protein
MNASTTSLWIRNVLFATDFSEESAAAVHYLQRLQRHYEAKVYVVHVMDLLPYALSQSTSAAAKLQEVRNESQSRMQHFMQTQHLQEGRVESALLSGEVFAATEKFAEEHAIDLIVLGSRAETGLGRLFDGSTAEEIFRTASSPVMVVGPGAVPHAGGGTFERLLFATDLSRFSRSALPCLESMLREGASIQVTLAHFLEDEGLGLYEQHHRRKRIEVELKELLPAALRGQIADVIVEFGSPQIGIAEVAQKWPADLVVLGVRSGGAFTRAATHGRSIAHTAINKSLCPVLTVRSR